MEAVDLQLRRWIRNQIYYGLTAAMIFNRMPVLVPVIIIHCVFLVIIANFSNSQYTWLYYYSTLQVIIHLNN